MLSDQRTLEPRCLGTAFADELQMPLKLSADDLKWLNVALETGCDETIPPFNKSRLIALGVIEMQGERCVLTEFGLAKLAYQGQH